MPTRVVLDWRGKALIGQMDAAAGAAIDERNEATANYARSNHPGWKTVTGAAAGSIRHERARREGHQTRGVVGSFGVDYFIWLELKNGSALRHAGDVEFPRLAGAMRQRIGAR
jgi:hypothetical protein